MNESKNENNVSTKLTLCSCAEAEDDQILTEENQSERINAYWFIYPKKLHCFPP